MSSLNVLDAVHTSPGRPKARQHDLLTVPETAAPETMRFRDSINACRRKDASTLDAPSVRLVMAFSGNSALHPVLDAHQMICRQLQPEFRVEESWWNFHALAHPSLREVTVADAARADIILIALHNATDPLWKNRSAHAGPEDDDNHGGWCQQGSDSRWLPRSNRPAPPWTRPMRMT
jgi:hypothetical protein